MALQQGLVAGSPPCGVQQDQIKRGGVRRAVIGRVRDQLEMSEFAVAHLVQDLARLGIAIIVLRLGLK